MKSSDAEYRTKVEFEINGSENVYLDYLTASMNNYDDEDQDEFDDSSTSLPKLIELDGYRPTMSLILPNRSIETIRNDDEAHSVLKSPATTTTSQAQTESYIFDEFCRFYKLRPFMTWLPPLKSQKNYRLKNNLVYFTQTSINEYLPPRFENFTLFVVVVV